MCKGKENMKRRLKTQQFTIVFYHWIIFYLNAHKMFQILKFKKILQESQWVGGRGFIISLYKCHFLIWQQFTHWPLPVLFSMLPGMPLREILVCKIYLCCEDWKKAQLDINLFVCITRGGREALSFIRVITGDSFRYTMYLALLIADC